MTITVEGADTLARTGAAAAAELGRLGDVHREIAQMVAGRVNAPRRTGALQASIRPTSSNTEAAVGTSLVYGAVQEYGWPHHHIRARRFLAAAFTASTDAAERIVADHAARAVAQVRGK